MLVILRLLPEQEIFQHAIKQLLSNSLFRAACFANFEGILGFSVHRQ